jgi:hypothetical protein
MEAHGDPLDLVERDLIGRPVVELCSPRRLVSGDLLGVF